MERGEIQHLLKKYIANQCTAEERERIEKWFDELDIPEEEIAEAKIARDISEVREQLQGISRRTARMRRFAVAAAVVLSLFSVSILLYYSTFQSNNSNQKAVAATPHDIGPGGNRATLTLANGKKISLDDFSHGQVIKDGENDIYKDSVGQLTYKHAGSTAHFSNAATINTLTTPKGGQYQLQLPDGTKVWLNAASSLTYDVNPTTDERIVKLRGEAYFEVSKDPSRPFKVHTQRQIVEVLGTHFNVNCYPDEPIVSTTLVEGSVKLIDPSQNKEVILHPGQQAILNRHDQLSISSVDTEETMAWKNGKFNFNKADIESVVRQLSRWYDVEVVYKGSHPTIALSGEVYRNTNASNVLKILSFYGLDCEIITSNGQKQIIIQ